ncbi:MAG: hypothetical protein LWX09_12880 [Bacteroidia bacterium]|nr:hypothetical protein [Bacteroidia bacterium]
MHRLLLIFALSLLVQLPLKAADKSFRHKHKKTISHNPKDPVSRKEEKLPKTFVLRPTRRHILGQQHR